MKIKIEVENENPDRPNEWRLRIHKDEEPVIQEILNVAPWNLPQVINVKLLNLLAKRAAVISPRTTAPVAEVGARDGWPSNRLPPQHTTSLNQIRFRPVTGFTE